MTAADLLTIVVWGGAGAALGGLYLVLLGRTVAAISDRSPRGAAGWLVLRLSLAVAGFWGAAMQGALPVVAMLAGFLVARSAAVARARRA